MTKKTLGAPKKPPADRKSEVVLLRLTASEKADCERAAELDGVKLATWARKALVGIAGRRIKRG